MIIGALLDLGFDLEELREKLLLLPLDGYKLSAKKCDRSGIQATKFDVHESSEHHHANHGHNHEDHEHHHEDHEHHHADHEHHHTDHEHHHTDHEHHHEDHEHHHRTFADIRNMIESSRLSLWVKEKSIEAFRRLAEAEGKIHGRPTDEVHFHEVGAVDSIVDIVGTMIIMESFR